MFSGDVLYRPYPLCSNDHFTDTRFDTGGRWGGDKILFNTGLLQTFRCTGLYGLDSVVN